MQHESSFINESFFHHLCLFQKSIEKTLTTLVQYLYVMKHQNRYSGESHFYENINFHPTIRNLDPE